uniref:Cadherin n=1 Tax=Manduca sexta TaxID=7130 RepID=UPI00201556D5|nr:Chain A, Cadherin [Manduca sexta]7TNI_B Chain B, Cadherin [Manduca sexta]7TNI_C Chain C, Cadherin [Manduca sexta]7TNI_D Chain D, Cadherin [Manduca sexta]
MNTIHHHHHHNTSGSGGGGGRLVPRGSMSENLYFQGSMDIEFVDPRPVFVRELYTAGISTADSIGRELLRLHATQSEGSAITYAIDWDTMVVDPSLEAVRQSAFVLNAQTGVLTLNIQPTATMHGLFKFEVTATDTAGAQDRTDVTVYVVSSQNR